MIKFTVYGSPVGYTRTTQRAKFSDEYKRYQAYKDAVVAAFYDRVKMGSLYAKKPLTTLKGQKTELRIKIYFRNFAHPDPSNVHKAIEDALFECDKFLDGQFKFFYDKQNPRVEVEIE